MGACKSGNSVNGDMNRGVKYTKHFLEGWENRSRETEKDMLQCLKARFLPNSRYANNIIDFVRSKLLSFKQNDFSGRNIFNAYQKRKRMFLRGWEALACQSLAF